MVMHARKLPRITDGYIDTQQSHLCQNSGYGGERYGMERSPGDGLRLSPDSSPRYLQKNSYTQRMRDKQRSKEANSSPEDRRRDGKTNDFRTNHERNHVEERVARIGDWSEHVSSSGKKYYHNWRTEVSQWEKPREWQEWEKRVAEKHSSWRATKSMFDRRSRHSNDGVTTRVTEGNHSSATASLTVQTSTGVEGTGPPTPTQSETQDCIDNRKGGSVEGGVSSSNSLGSVPSLSVLRPLAPTLTPTLVNYHRDDLIQHVSGWSGGIIEKQASRCSEEAHVVGCLHCTKVSAELKMARSLVRLAEIQATLQEQRILFLRQQIRELEEMKSQTSFMSDSIL